MITYQLKIKLLSDTTIGRGDGVAGSVDQEVEHDSNGFPYLRGRTLKGLLSEECDNLIAVLPDESKGNWEQVACNLFGKPGSSIKTIGKMHVGDACLPLDLRKAVVYQMKRTDNKLTRLDILQSLTTIRSQTAINSQTGTPDEKSLRSFRVMMRELEFNSPLSFETEPNNNFLTLLSVGTLALRRLGSGRNRGRGYVKCFLIDSDIKDITGNFLQDFA